MSEKGYSTLSLRVWQTPRSVLAPPCPLCSTIKKIPPSTPPSAVSHSASPPLLDPGRAWLPSDRPTGWLFLLQVMSEADPGVRLVLTFQKFAISSVRDSFRRKLISLT